MRRTNAEVFLTSTVASPSSVNIMLCQCKNCTDRDTQIPRTVSHVLINSVRWRLVFSGQLLQFFPCV